MKLRCYAKWLFQLGTLMPELGRFAITIRIIEAPAALQRTVQIHKRTMRILEISSQDKSIVQIGFMAALKFTLFVCALFTIKNGICQNVIAQVRFACQKMD